MSAYLPMHVQHGGRIDAAGIWFAGASSDPELQARVFDASAPGRRLLQTPGGVLVLFASVQRLDADHSPGLLLVARGQGYASFPVSAAERQRFLPGADVWLRVHHGCVERIELSTCEPVDVSAWIDVDDWTVVESQPLGRRSPTRTPRVVAVADDETTDTRALLGNAIPKASKEHDALLEALSRARPSSRAQAGDLRGIGGGGGSGPEDGILGAFLAWLAGGFGGSSGGGALPPGGFGGGARGGHGGSGAMAAAPPGPGRLRRWLTRLVGQSPLSLLIGKKQANYIERTLDLFERGNFDEALRHAIPFSSLPGAPTPPSLRVPSPRASLDLRAAAGPAASSSLNLGDELYARFKQLYRDAAKKLEAQGRLEEAAYIFFELLGEPDEGVALLERHEKFALAARMAQGRELAPGLVIRLWFLAGEPAKALLVARRTGAFADAIRRLDAAHPEHSTRLRLLWADRLASAGDYAAAVDVISNVPEVHGLAHAWIDRAIACGGEVAARMIPRKLKMWPDDPQVRAEVEAHVLRWCVADEEGAPQLRRSLGNAWDTDLRDRPELAAVVLPLARRLMQDSHAISPAITVRRLARHLPVFAADLARARVPPEPAEPEERVRVFQPYERGLTPVLDAARLPNGRFVLALGEAGLRLVDADGNVQRSYAHPISEIVLSDSGARMIGIHPRGDTQVLCRVDLERGALTPWCETKLARWTRQYDGAVWYVATQDAVMSLDAQADGFDALWTVSGLPGDPVAMQRSPSHLRFACRDAGFPDYWIWHYELTEAGPVMRLRLAGPEISKQCPPAAAVELDDAGRFCSWGDEAPEGRARVFGSENGVKTNGSIPLPLRIHVSDHVMSLSKNDVGLTLHRLAFGSFTPHADLELRGSATGGLHADGDGLILYDELGRVLVLDKAGRITRWFLTKAM